MELNRLEGTHQDHDSFVRYYINQRDVQNDDVVTLALNASLIAQKDEKPALVDFVERSMTSASQKNPHVHRLALYIMLRHYAEQWPLMFDPTYELLCSILQIIRRTNVDIYPPKWTEKIFRLESIISPNDLRGLIFGIDPIPSSKGHGQFATGHAFAFDLPPDAIDEPSPSTNGLMKAYGLTRSVVLDRSITLEHYFVQTYGIGLINFIRTIKAGSLAGSRNDFKNAWSAYNLSWLGGLPDVIGNVLIFQNENYIFDDYASAAVKVKLYAAPRCSHPSYIKVRDGHCLREPKTSYVTYRGRFIPDIRPNQSVLDFVAFLRRLEAEESIRCLCVNCVANETNEMLRDFLGMML